MSLRILILTFFLTPLVSFSQTNHDTLNPERTKEIYSIIRLVIKKEKLDKNYGLELSPSPNCNLTSDDTTYLHTLLIKPSEVDTTSLSSTESGVVSSFTWPDKNILTQADVAYILETKTLFKDFKWDNNQLGFNLKNSKSHYTFSVSYFNLKQDKAILMYDFLCPGLCGHGSIILVSKAGKSWDITWLEMWFH